MIRLVLTDLDGTLLNSQGKISQKNLECINRIRNRGVVFAIATGRYKAGCRPILKMLNFREEDICCAYDNGCHVVANGRTIHDGSISRADMHEVVKFLRKLECTPALYIGDNWIVEKKDNFYDSISAFYDGNGLIINFDDVLINQKDKFPGPIKVAIRALPENIDRIQSQIKEKFPSYDYYLSSPTILEMNYMGENKANALRILAKYHNIGLEDTMAFGDYDNDAQMIEKAGIGVAMLNASARVKQASDFVTLSNDDDGFFHAIEKFCLKG